MATMRAGGRALALCLLLASGWAAWGAAPPQPEDREVPPDRGKLALKDDAFKRVMLELKDAGKPVEQRVELIGLFAYFREARAVPELIALVQSPKEAMALKSAALWALGEIGDPRGMVAFQYALNRLYVKDPEWTGAKGVTAEVDGKEREVSLRELCEARLGRLAEAALAKTEEGQKPQLVELLLSPLAGGTTPAKPPEENEHVGRMRAALLSVAAVGDRSPTALKALTTVLTADDNYYPWDFKVIAAEALSTILVRRADELKSLKAHDKLSDEIAAAFIQAFGVTDIPEVREIGAPALRHTGWGDRAARSLVTVLQTPNLPKAVRYRAIEALAFLESQQAADHLIFLLFDADKNIRWRAAVALGTCGDQRAAAFLRQLAKDPDAFVRLKAVGALGRLREFSVLPDLAVAIEDPDFRVRRQAALALGRLGFRQGIPALVNSGLKDPSPSVRAMSIIALGYITRAEGLKAVPPMLADPDPGVRRVAVQVLDKFVNPGATRALVAALGDADKDVRADAAKAVADRIERNPRETLDLLTEAIAKSQGEGRLAAVQCLAADYAKARGAKDPKRRTLYERGLDSPKDDLAAALLAALRDGKPETRAAAGKLLADHAFAHRNKALLTPVAALANDPDRAVRNIGLMADNYLRNLR